MTEHFLKILPEYYDAVKRGEKTFEVRFNDRGFEKGDVLVLAEWQDGGFTGREIRARVTYLLTLAATLFGQWGDHCVRSIRIEGELGE